MMPLTLVLDLLGIASALLAAWFWYLAGLRRLRRISKFEELDATDINRLVTAINRSNVLNGRAALAAAFSAASLAVRFGLEVIAGW